MSQDRELIHVQGPDWVKEFPGAVTVCDTQGVILYMNDRASAVLGNGESLAGRNVLDCHPEPARSKLAALLASGSSNTYTIEKYGVKKMIHQAPWYENGQMQGLVELSFEIPSVMAHHVRTPQAPRGDV